MIYFTAHTIKCVCHSIGTMFGVLGIYNFGPRILIKEIWYGVVWRTKIQAQIMYSENC